MPTRTYTWRITYAGSGTRHIRANGAYVIRAFPAGQTEFTYTVQEGGVLAFADTIQTTGTINFQRIRLCPT